MRGQTDSQFVSLSHHPKAKATYDTSYVLIGKSCQPTLDGLNNNAMLYVTFASAFDSHIVLEASSMHRAYSSVVQWKFKLIICHSQSMLSHRFTVGMAFC